MELFTRDMVLMGPPREVRSWCIRIAEMFGEAAGRTPEVWAAMAGGVAGHHTWTLPVDGSAELMNLTMAALANDEYVAAIEEGRPFFTAPARDTVHRPYVEPAPETSEPGHVASVTTAVARAGNLGHAVGWGLEAAEYVQRLTGLPVTMTGAMLGSFSRLTWMAVAPDAAEADAANRAMNADDGYRKLVARGGDDFVDGSARTQFFIRIG